MTHWLDRAACRDVDPEIFFPTGSGVLGEREVIRAKAVCRLCPVRPECLHWARPEPGRGLPGDRGRRDDDQ